MILLNHIDRKWYVFNKETNRLEIRKDAPKEIQELEKENKEMLDDMEKVSFGNFGKRLKMPSDVSFMDAKVES